MSRPIKALQNESVPALPVKHTTSLIKYSPCSAAVSRRFTAGFPRRWRILFGYGTSYSAPRLAPSAPMPEPFPPHARTSTPLDLHDLWLAVCNRQHLLAGRSGARDPAAERPIVCPEKQTGPGTLRCPARLSVSVDRSDQPDSTAAKPRRRRCSTIASTPATSERALEPVAGSISGTGDGEAAETVNVPA